MSRNDVQPEAAARQSYLSKTKSKYLETKRKTLIKNLMEFDKEKRGSFQIDQVADIVEKLMAEQEASAKKNKIIVLLAIGILLLSAAVFGAVIAGNELTKESVVSDGILVSADSEQTVSTGSILEKCSISDLLLIETEEALRQLDGMVSFPVVLDRDGSTATLWLKPIAYETVHDDADDEYFSAVTIYSEFNSYALKVNATDLYYRTEPSTWVSASANSTNNEPLKLSIVPMTGAGSIFG